MRIRTLFNLLLLTSAKNSLNLKNHQEISRIVKRMTLDTSGEKEQIYLLGDLGKLLDRYGSPVIPSKPSYSALYSYHRWGKKNLDGVSVFLETTRLPEGMATSVEAYHRWLDELRD